MKLEYLEHREKIIYKEIEKRDRIRYNELKRIIAKKKPTSPRTFRKKIKSLMAKKLIIRIKLSKQNVVYSTRSRFSEVEAIRIFQEVFFDRIDDYFDKFYEKYDKISILEQATCLKLFYNLIGLFENLFKPLANKESDPSFKKNLNKIEKMKEKIFSVFAKSKNKKLHDTFASLCVDEAECWFNELQKTLKK